MSEEFEVGKTYVVCEGFYIPDTLSWVKETGITKVGDTFTVAIVNRHGHAEVDEIGGSVIARSEELLEGKCKLVDSESVTGLDDFIKSLMQHTNTTVGEGPTSPPLSPTGVCPVMAGLCTQEELDGMQEVIDSGEEDVTGGSSPAYYRKPMTLPETSDRTVFHSVDLEAGDVSNAWDLNGNEFNILKSVLRGDNKEGVDAKYALDKIIWFALREELRLDIITHEEFWQKAVAVGLAKEL